MPRTIDRIKTAAWKKSLAEHGIDSERFRKLSEAGRFVRESLPHCQRLANGLTATFLSMNGAPLPKVARRAQEIEQRMRQLQRSGRR